MHLAADQLRQEACPTCGSDIAECGHPAAEFYAQRLVCRRTMAAKAAANLYQQMHKDRPFHDGTFPKDPHGWSESASRATPYHFMDGVSFYATPRDLSPDDDFLSWGSGASGSGKQEDAHDG